MNEASSSEAFVFIARHHAEWNVIIDIYASRFRYVDY